MKSKFLCLSLGLLSLSACVTPLPKGAVSSENLVELQQQITSMEASVTASIKSACETNTAELSKEIHRDLRKKLDDAEKSASLARKKVKVVAKQCNEVIAEKIILGEVERVLFEDEELSLDARIDTGAETSSLGIYGLTEFERDGKNWVRFKLKNLKKAPSFEYRIRDDVRIKQRQQDDLEKRFEVKIDVQLGGKRYRRQVFNLADRRHLEYQVLLGRSFLKDIAIVDVSLKKQLSKRK